MSLPNRDEVEGKLDQAKGVVKENVGRAINDRDMEDEGIADRASGNVQEGYGETKRKVGDTIKDIGDAVGR
ncbi:MAG: CsbD family protein [Pyrinomonadaceae bacterium]|nr:CsbD family protein [Pyrinomonadaceae bacterium]